jgi:hypothetical protein
MNYGITRGDHTALRVYTARGRDDGARTEICLMSSFQDQVLVRVEVSRYGVRNSDPDAVLLDAAR